MQIPMGKTWAGPLENTLVFPGGSDLRGVDIDPLRDPLDTLGYAQTHLFFHLVKVPGKIKVFPVVVNSF